MTANKIAFALSFFSLRVWRRCLPFYYLFHGSEFHKLYLLHLPIEMSQNRNLERKKEEEEKNVNLNYLLKEICFSWKAHKTRGKTDDDDEGDEETKKLHHSPPNIFIQRCIKVFR
jgi:hypothetical protein